MRTKPALIALAAIVLALGIGGPALKRIREADAELRALAPLAGSLQSRIAAASERLLAAQQALSEGARAAPAGAAATGAANAQHAATATAIPAKTAGAARPLSPDATIGNDPVKLAAYVRNYREGLEINNGGMFKTLGFSPEQAAKWQDLQVRFEERRMEMRGVAEASGVDTNGKPYREMMKGIFDERIAAEKEVLGPDLDARYREFTRLQFLRSTVQKLASAEVYPDPPMAGAQVERVVETVAKHSGREPSQSWPAQHWATIDWDAALPALQGTLSSAQIESLQLFAKQGALRAAYDKRVTELQKEAARIARQTGG